MDDSRTDARTGSDAGAKAEYAALRDEVQGLREQLAERDRRIAELRDEITILRDETRDLKGLPKRPRMKPGGIAAAAGAADTGKSAKTDGRGRGRK